ncbi:MAG: DUF5687 family protein [Prevotella sp.]|jgi:hypothetical protein|nr:DUF5687 family protein [Prevotella sp.]
MQETTFHKRFSIYRALLHHRRLAEKRSLFHGKNQAAKVALSIAGAVILVYLFIVSISLALMVSEDHGMSPIGVLFSLMPFLVALDFLLRFIVQQTPSQMVRPYSLLPLPKHVCIESFLISNLLSIGNFIWLVLIVPYTVMTILPEKGLLAAFCSILACQWMIWLSSQFFLLTRTRINDSVSWLILPLVLFAVLFLPIYVGESAGWDQYYKVYTLIGNHLAHLNVLYWTVLTGMLVLLFFLNRKEQEKHIWKELSKVTETSVHNISKYRFLDRWGKIGEYLQLEFKLIFRNVNPRKTLLFTVLSIFFYFAIFLCTADATETANNGSFSWESDFWCFICFILPGSMLSSRLMSYEGNYIDFFMVRKNNLYPLLLTKYYCFIGLLSIPLIVSIAAVILGRWRPLMISAYALYAAGPQLITVMYTAIINDQTTPLDTRLTSRTSKDYNYLAMVIQFCTFLLPAMLIALFKVLFNSSTAYLMLIILSIPFLLSHRWWISQIYQKMMKRKYEHLENFRASR